MRRTLFLYMVMLISLTLIFNSYVENRTYAYFNDAQSVEYTIIAAGNGSDSDQISISGDGMLTGNGEKLHDIVLDNIELYNNDPQNSTIITDMQVWLNAPQESITHITKITFSGHDFFSGSAIAGSVIDGKDYTINAGDSAKLEIYFSENVSEMSPITLSFGMLDGSKKVAVFNPTYRAENGGTI